MARNSFLPTLSLLHYPATAVVSAYGQSLKLARRGAVMADPNGTCTALTAPGHNFPISHHTTKKRPAQTATASNTANTAPIIPHYPKLR